MTFSIYDVLSKLLPGGIIYALLVLGQLVPKSDRLTDTLALVLMYLIGYFIDATASLFEPLLHKLMGGKPSARLLQDQFKGRQAVFLLPTLVHHMQQTYPDYAKDRTPWFDIISRTVNQKNPPRVASFLEAYAFARNIFLSLVISIPLVCFGFDSYKLIGAAIVLAVIAFLRTKSRGYYFAKEVINSYMIEKCIETATLPLLPSK